MSAVLEAPRKRRVRLSLTTSLSLYLVQAPERPYELPAQDGLLAFQSAVVAASSAAEAKELVRGRAYYRNQWNWVDDEIAVKRLAAESNVSKPRIFSLESRLI